MAGLRLHDGGRAASTAECVRAVSPASMKIYLIYDEGPAEFHHKLAITLPSKWLEQSADKVKELFVERYNKKFPDNELDDEELVLAVKDDSPFTNRTHKHLNSSDTPGQHFAAGMEVRLVPPPKAQIPGRTASGKLQCKNFGCQCEYDENDNPEGGCRHHVAPPMFHDTRKWWTCCEDVKVFEFDELMNIPGCVRGKHSNQVPAVEQQRLDGIKQANAAALKAFDAKIAGKVGADGSAPPPKQNVTAAAAAPPKPKKKRPPTLPKGYDRCKHYGCQADYLTESNVDGCCVYHKDAPIFHEGAKKWVCCGATKFDFDDFMAVPGCTVGRHSPVQWADDEPTPVS